MTSEQLAVFLGGLLAAVGAGFSALFVALLRAQAERVGDLKAIVQTFSPTLERLAKALEQQAESNEFLRGQVLESQRATDRAERRTGR